MKRVLLITLIVYAFAYGKAQTVTVPEPEFADQSIFLTSDSTGNLLPREDAILKTKAAASLYLTGIGKIKTRLTLNGITSTTLVKKEKSMRIIIKAINNLTDPKSFISIFKFEVSTNKRQALLSEYGTFTGVSTKSLANVDYVAKKYGESSYLISIEGLEVGEYGIHLGDPSSITGKNRLKITTFSVSDDGKTPGYECEENLQFMKDNPDVTIEYVE